MSKKRTMEGRIGKVLRRASNEVREAAVLIIIVLMLIIIAFIETL